MSDSLFSDENLEELRAQAWSQFYEYCFEVINNSAAVRKLNEVDREDCVQEVMTEIVRRFGQAELATPPEEVKGLLVVLSRNKATDIVRRKYRKRETLFDDGTGALLCSRDQSMAEDAVGQGESISLVWEALVSLDQQVSVTSYLIFYLRAIENWPIQEIADLFQITAEQARARCHRVKKKFEALLKTPETPPGR